MEKGDIIQNDGGTGKWKGRRVLVTGFGFIGRHVVAELQRQGCSVAVLERKPDMKLVAATGVDPIVGDVRDEELLAHVVPEFDGLIHLAALLGTTELIQDPAAAVNANLIGAINAFQACRRAQQLGRRVPCVQITAANFFMDNPYAITKHASERFAKMFNQEHKTDIRVVRAQNVYGEHQLNFPIQKIVPRFVGWALRGEPLRIYGDGSQVQDMIYVGDVARVLVHALFAPENPGDIISAGTGKATTVLDVAREVIAATGSASRLDHVPMRAGEPEGSVVLGDPSTLPPIGIGPESLTPFRAGIARTAAWYRENPSALGPERLAIRGQQPSRLAEVS